MLLKREDLRGRMIRLIGQGRISATTRAMDDAGSRVARYLTMLLLVNVSFGSCIAIGLYFIGVPNAALWGASRRSCDSCRTSECGSRPRFLC
jgi:Predicted permease